MLHIYIKTLIYTFPIFFCLFLFDSLLGLAPYKEAIVNYFQQLTGLRIFLPYFIGLILTTYGIRRQLIFKEMKGEYNISQMNLFKYLILEKHMNIQIIKNDYYLFTMKQGIYNYKIFINFDEYNKIHVYGHNLLFIELEKFISKTSH